jgi:hypothetical protein
MESFGTALFVVGYAVALVGGIWYLIAAFRESIWWGLGVMLIPFVEFFFLFACWEEAKKPFGISLLGTLLVLVSVFVFDGPMMQSL